LTNIVTTPLSNAQLLSLLSQTSNQVYGGSFTFPILTRPESAFEILLGRPNVDIFVLNMPQLHAEFEEPMTTCSTDRKTEPMS
jgi:hypothetical protein